MSHLLNNVQSFVIMKEVTKKETGEIPIVHGNNPSDLGLIYFGDLVCRHLPQLTSFNKKRGLLVLILRFESCKEAM